LDRDRRERERWIGESEIRTDTLNRRERECEQRILRWNTQSGEGGRNGAMNSGIEWTYREFGKMGGLGFGKQGDQERTGSVNATCDGPASA
jgi:hypothetical protein